MSNSQQASFVLIIAGPTASGKSGLAIDAARIFDGVIINCDAMQIYKGIPVIAATPNEAEKKLAKHKLFELYDIDKHGNVVEWLDLCVAEIKQAWAEKKLPIVVGGTGMYIDALINGVTPIPEVPRQIREKVRGQSLPELYEYLQQYDTVTAEKLHHNDKTRIMRAVEIMLFTGKKLSDWYKVPLVKKLPQASFRVVKIVPSLELIEQRCRLRLDKMVYEQGAVEEVQKIAAQNLLPDLPAMKALGVPELLQYVKGEKSLDEAVSLAKLHTRQYAKRQRTWLNNKLAADVQFDEPYDGQNEYLQQIASILK